MSETSLRKQSVLTSVENKIQRLLLDLDEELRSVIRMRIDHVDVDTRNFANMRVEIKVVEIRGSGI